MPSDVVLELTNLPRWRSQNGVYVKFSKKRSKSHSFISYRDTILFAESPWTHCGLSLQQLCKGIRLRKPSVSARQTEVQVGGVLPERVPWLSGIPKNSATFSVIYECLLMTFLPLSVILVSFLPMTWKWCSAIPIQPPSLLPSFSLCLGVGKGHTNQP